MAVPKIETSLSEEVRLAELFQTQFSNNIKLETIERAAILAALRQNNSNRTHTARALGIGIRTLQRKIKQYACDIGDSVYEKFLVK